MVRVQRANLLDPTAPNPSVETLLHAFLPHKFVDHTHANAVLAWSISRTARRICAEVFGDADGHRALRHAGFRARQDRRPRSSTPSPTSRD